MEHDVVYETCIYNNMYLWIGWSAEVFHLEQIFLFLKQDGRSSAWQVELTMAKYDVDGDGFAIHVFRLELQSVLWYFPHATYAGITILRVFNRKIPTYRLRRSPGLCFVLRTAKYCESLGARMLDLQEFQELLCPPGFRAHEKAGHLVLVACWEWFFFRNSTAIESEVLCSKLYRYKSDVIYEVHPISTGFDEAASAVRPQQPKCKVDGDWFTMISFAVGG